MNNTERNMAAAILRFEDSRVTGPASLRVSRLPAADKGGKWEICGICDGIEPAVFNRLKSLLDAGKREEAWEGCLQYVLDWLRCPPGYGIHPARPLLQFRQQEHRENPSARTEYPRRRAHGGRHCWTQDQTRATGPVGRDGRSGIFGWPPGKAQGVLSLL